MGKFLGIMCVCLDLTFSGDKLRSGQGTTHWSDRDVLVGRFVLLLTRH